MSHSPLKTGWACVALLAIALAGCGGGSTGHDGGGGNAGGAGGGGRGGGAGTTAGVGGDGNGGSVSNGGRGGSPGTGGSAGGGGSAGSGGSGEASARVAVVAPAEAVVRRAAAAVRADRAGRPAEARAAAAAAAPRERPAELARRRRWHGRAVGRVLRGVHLHRRRQQDRPGQARCAAKPLRGVRAGPTGAEPFQSDPPAELGHGVRLRDARDVRLPASISPFRFVRSSRRIRNGGPPADADADDRHRRHADLPAHRRGLQWERPADGHRRRRSPQLPVARLARRRQ